MSCLLSSYQNLRAFPNLPHAENIRDDNIHELHEATAGDTLQCPRCDQHLHAVGQGAHDRAATEDGNSNEEYGLAAPNVRDLSPYGGACSISQKVRASNPRIAGCGV